MLNYVCKLQELIDGKADKSKKNNQGKLAVEVASSADVKAELKVLTDQGMWSLAKKITSIADLKEIAISGLKIDAHIVEKHINNEKGDISSATHKILQDWRKSVDNNKVAYNQLYEALGVAEMSGLREDLLNKPLQEH